MTHQIFLEKIIDNFQQKYRHHLTINTLSLSHHILVKIMYAYKVLLYNKLSEFLLKTNIIILGKNVKNLDLIKITEGIIKNFLQP